MTQHSAREIMTSRLETIRFDASMREAFEAMKEHKIRHLPVVDDDGLIVGLLSDRDVQRSMVPRKDGPSFEEPSCEFDPSHRVGDFMSWPVKAVEQHERVADVAERMLREKVSAFLVFTSNRAPVGIVTTDDLLKLLVSLLKKEPSAPSLLLASLLDFESRAALGYQ